MFDRIAPRYDLLNRLLSFGRDASWRRRAVALAGLGPGERALDVGAGTGDLAFALATAAPSGRVIALDLAIYGQHVAFHAVGPLWRLHRMHHADLDFDATTGIRFHPVEILLSLLK